MADWLTNFAYLMFSDAIIFWWTNPLAIAFGIVIGHVTGLRMSLVLLVILAVIIAGQRP